jgi:hypothetical protein
MSRIGRPDHLPLLENPGCREPGRGRFFGVMNISKFTFHYGQTLKKVIGILKKAA